MRDSVEHPISTPIIFTFDVTGSNVENAKVVQQMLPKLMEQITAVCANPQIAIWANDDVNVEDENALQLGEFESDIRIDEAIRNIWLTSDGGGNNGESYDLLLYAASRKTITDSMEKRNKRGYMFLYADELFFPKTKSKDINMIFDDTLEGDINLVDLINEVLQKWEVFVIWPQTGYAHARQQYVELFGEDHVQTLQDPHLMCEKVASIISMRESQYQASAIAATIDMSEDFHARVE